MKLITRPVMLAGAAALAGVPAIALAAPASAADSWQIPVLNTTATEAGLCYGTIRGNVDHGQSDRINVALTSAFQGIGTCQTTATVSWRNLDTGAKGSGPVELVGSWYNSVEFKTGPGHFEVTVTTSEFYHSPGSVSTTVTIG